MSRGYGFLSLALPPFVVYALMVLEFFRTLTVPVSVLVAIYPIGILTIVIYSFSYRAGSSVPKSYLEFTRGARGAILLSFAGSVAVGILPVYFGEQLLGVGLVSVSLGSLWLPSAAAAGVYGSLIYSADLLENKGTTHGGIATLFVALFLGKTDFLKRRWRESTISVILLGGFYLLGWVNLSQAGGFPVTLIGLSLMALVPLSSYRVFHTSIKPEDRDRIIEILNQQSPKPSAEI